MPHLALVFAAIWLANAPEGVIATYSLALVLLISAARQRSVRPLVIGAQAMAAGFGLAAFYILPAAWERGWVQISGVLATNLLPEHNFLFTHSSDAEFQLFNWKISSVAVGMILATAIAVAFAWPQRRPLGEILVDAARPGSCRFVFHAADDLFRCGGICLSWYFCSFRGDGWGRCRLGVRVFSRRQQSPVWRGTARGRSQRRCCSCSSASQAR